MLPLILQNAQWTDMTCSRLHQAQRINSTKQKHTPWKWNSSAELYHHQYDTVHKVFTKPEVKQTLVMCWVLVWLHAFTFGGIFKSEFMKHTGKPNGSWFWVLQKRTRQFLFSILQESPSKSLNNPCWGFLLFISTFWCKHTNQKPPGGVMPRCRCRRQNRLHWFIYQTKANSQVFCWFFFVGRWGSNQGLANKRQTSPKLSKGNTFSKTEHKSKIHYPNHNTGSKHSFAGICLRQGHSYFWEQSAVAQ